MIAPNIVAEIQRLLAETKLSQRTIAKLTRISRGTIRAIASGKRPNRETSRSLDDANIEEDPCGPPQRCNGCGGMVYMPCRLCRQRDRIARHGLRILATGPEDKLGPAFRPEHQARYDEVRAWRKANHGQPIKRRTAR